MVSDYLSFLISYFSFLTSHSHLSYRAKTFDKSFKKGLKFVLSILQKFYPTLINNYKLLINCPLKKYISKHYYKKYVNSCKFIDNKCRFNNKNVFTAIKVVHINGGSG